MSLRGLSTQYLQIESVAADTVVVHVELDRLTDDINLEQLGQHLYAIVEEQGCRRLSVNLDSVRSMAAAALGKLIVLHRKMHRHSGRLLFCNVHPLIEDALRASHLWDYLQIVPDLNGALSKLTQA